MAASLANENLMDRPDVREAIWTTLESISKADELPEACKSFSQMVTKLGGQLLSVKVVDIDGRQEAIRPWSTLPENIQLLGRQSGTGCVFHREAMVRIRPFLMSEIDRWNYCELGDRRFLCEMDKLGFHDVFTIPVMLGRGMIFSVIGMASEMSPTSRNSAVDMVGHIIAAMLLRFPEVGRLFEERRLSVLESSILKMKSHGNDTGEIRQRTGLNETTQSHLLESARLKLGAKNGYELVRIATLMGEIDH